MKVQIKFHGGPQDGNVRTFDERFVGLVINVASTPCCYEHTQTIAYRMQGTTNCPFTYSVERNGDMVTT